MMRLAGLSIQLCASILLVHFLVFELSYSVRISPHLYMCGSQKHSAMCEHLLALCLQL